jgi:predicted Fe-S protein YdhL (DUF1289 family)
METVSKTNSIPEQSVASPCVLVCNMDIHTGLCLGCARTLDEIARWSSMSEDHKRQVLALLPARHRKLQVEDI